MAPKQWLSKGNPDTDVVRLQRSSYHFTLFSTTRKEKFVDWFGYDASVSVAALETLWGKGYRLKPEDVDEGAI